MMPKTAKKRKYRWIKPVIIILIIAGIAVWYYFSRIAPSIFTIITERVRMQVSEAIDNMTDSELQNVDYNDLVIVRYNSDGYVSILQVNSVAVDLFARRVTSLIRTEMEKFEEQGVSMPFGTVTGMPFMSGIGPDITVNAISLGVVDADFSSEFVSAGLNQTIHRLYLTIVVNLKIVLPGYTIPLDNSSKVMICESVIAGEVPFGDVNIGEGVTGELVP